MARERHIDIGALTLAVDEAGEGGHPLMLIHGWTGNKADFEPVIDVLADAGWHVVAPDNRGHGGSDQVEGEDAYSFSIMADDALALADRLGWGTFVVLGHSMGGMVVQELVLTAPERVRSLILVDTSHRQVPINPDLVQLGVQIARTEGLEVLVAAQRELDDPLATAAHLRMCETVPGYADLGDKHTLLCSADMYASMLRQITEPHDRLPELASVACPTLVIVGEQDTPFLQASRRIAETIPAAQLVVLADAGHSPQCETTDAFLATVVPFLDSLDA